ncbi:sugar phosphate isomerase/epimerase and 4-hydroxyphenylpyruvate domain-containing protein [Piscicoccus intestinalis]|uniref:sugar phosphate isomerase/epimerase and 4-hydroxyphenylpyruvate domain-containing protein n=1 Tax=Piscicoccus intestinalis TaxID=746033 RepID=UPI0008385F97|nr:sugar phosphate isomerase/epimerase and 4-hydroxyphenylpyruvate domain-containing protein [Piscicoccus intestinalis]
MRTSIATVSLSGTLEAKLQASAAAGFDGVELFEPDLIASTRTPEQVRELAAALGLTLDLYQPFRDIEGVGPVPFADNLRRARHKFELMNRLGIPAILVCSNVGTATIDDDGLAAEQLHRLGELAAEHGVRVAYEALAWGRFVNTYQHAWRLVRRADHPNVGICLDNFHISSRGDDQRDIEKIPAEKIEFVQLADAPLLRMDLLSWSRHHRVFPGQGGWDVPDFLGRVLRAGYRGPISLEIFNDTVRQTDVDRTAADAMRSLRWLEEQTAERLQGGVGAAGAAGDAPGAVPLRRLTRVEPPTGVDFVEVRGQEGLELLDEVLAHLGFSYAGTHPTRPMRLWTLAGARVVVHEAPTPQGRPALTGIGLRVEDPARSLARAAELMVPSVSADSGPSDDPPGGVLAPDGTQIFFTGPDATWADLFSVAPGDPRAHLVTPPEHAESNRIDHINLDQPWQHQAEGLLFLSSALGLEPLPSIDLASPIGLVRSQVMRTADRSVTLALDVASPMARRPIGTRPGIGRAQHVGVTCPDLVAFARHARARGLTPLPVPANYYEDLAARFELTPQALATLRDLDLLYDRDERGEYLHMFTPSVGEFFVEIVQRAHGYDGFGAANAPVRLASQHVTRLQAEPATPAPPAT